MSLQRLRIASFIDNVDDEAMIARSVLIADPSIRVAAEIPGSHSALIYPKGRRVSLSGSRRAPQEVTWWSSVQWVTCCELRPFIWFPFGSVHSIVFTSGCKPDVTSASAKWSMFNSQRKRKWRMHSNLYAIRGDATQGGHVEALH